MKNESINRQFANSWTGPVIVIVLLAIGLCFYFALRLIRPPQSPRQIWSQAAGITDLNAVNIILITIDTLRADHLPAYGYDNVETPHIDRLAQEGVVFSNAATTVPFTLPAHSSIMTGTYPAYHGVRENVGFFLDDRAPTMAEILAEAGLATGGFVSAFVLDGRWGIGRGFGDYYDDFDLHEMERANLGSVQRDGKETVAEAIDWLQASTGDAFFLWLHLFEPHDPYTPPEPFRSRYPTRPYDGEIAYVDSLLGEFRQELEDLGHWERSLVILTGDHGEGLGNHRETFHGFFVYESTIHVPLIVRLPVGGFGGLVVDAAVSHVDLLPTVLETTGRPIPPHIQGQSLLPLILGMEHGRDRVALSESLYPLLHYGWSPLRSIRTRDFKYIEAPRPEIYEINADPDEEENLFRKRQGLAKELSARLGELEKALEYQGERRNQQPDLDVETLQQLQALGYMAGSSSNLSLADGEVDRPDPKDTIKLHQYVMLAQSDMGNGDLESAANRLNEVLKSDPAIIDAYQMLGNIAAQRQEYEQAAEQFKKALEHDNQHRASLFGLANSYRKLGREDEAIVGFSRLLDINAYDSQSALALVDIFVDRNLIREAIEVLMRAAGRADAPALLHNQLGELLILDGRREEAREALLQSVKNNDQLAQPRFNLAVLSEDAGDFAPARKYYEETIVRAPKHFQALFNLGRLYGRSGETERQMSCYEAALEANPEFVRGYYFLAKLLMDLGSDLQRAEELTREGLQRDPDGRAGPLGYFLLADILNRGGRPVEARSALEQARQIQAEQTNNNP